MIRREDFGGLDERDTPVLPSFDLGGLHPVFVHDLTNRLLNITLLSLIAPRPDVGDGYVVIPPMPIVKKGLSQGENIAPLSLGLAGLRQGRPNFPGHHKPLNAGAVDDLLSYPLQVGQAHTKKLSGA